MDTALQVYVDKDYYSDIGNDDKSICEKYPQMSDTLLNYNKVNCNYDAYNSYLAVQLATSCNYMSKLFSKLKQQLSHPNFHMLTNKMLHT